jgi:hypothetical protein
MYRVRDLKNDVIVVDNLSTQQDADSWVTLNVDGPNEEGKLELANTLIEEY